MATESAVDARVGDTPLVTLELGRVAHLVLDNPPLNLLSQRLLEQLDMAIRGLEAADPNDVRAVIVSGAGERAFSAGSDVREFAAHGGPGGRDLLEREEAVTKRLAELPMPSIAAIEGNALGGGLEVALACDLRVASERALLGLPEVRLAVTPGAGGTQRLPRIVGLAHAKELILTGAVVGAAEALRIGLVDRVAPPGQAFAVAQEIAMEMAQRGPLAVREAKRLLDRSLEVSLEDGLAAELEASVRIFETDDLAEGAAAFLAKREPDYHGR
jgi:enoyl-CoA hydratase